MWLCAELEPIIANPMLISLKTTQRQRLYLGRSFSRLMIIIDSKVFLVPMSDPRPIIIPCHIPTLANFCFRPPPVSNSHPIGVPCHISTLMKPDHQTLSILCSSETMTSNSMTNDMERPLDRRDQWSRLIMNQTLDTLVHFDHQSA